MKCERKGCPGRYKDVLITSAVRPGSGSVVVIRNVPAMECDFCGFGLLTMDTVSQEERIDRFRPEPIGSVPLYDYAQAFPEQLRERLIANGYGTVNMTNLPPFKCRFPGHPGIYEQETTVYHRCRDGQLVLVNNVPQLVCNICADILFEEQTLRQLDRLLESDTAPIGTAPLYDFAQGAEEMQSSKELVEVGK